MISSPESFLDGKVTLFAGDCLEVLEGFEANSFDACVTDPPYGLGFMGKAWDYGVPGVLYWKRMQRVLKPGAHLLAFGGTRTFGRMQVAIEDAGFEIRDTIMWLYGSGFPKSLDVSKAIDKSAGAEREKIGVSADAPAYQRSIGNHRPWMDDPDHKRDGPIPATAAAAAWSGFGTALKPACEPIVLARKPLEGTVSQNVLKWGTGALNIDGCRVATDEAIQSGAGRTGFGAERDDNYQLGTGRVYGNTSGRWPANVIHDGSEEVVGAFPSDLKSGAAVSRSADTAVGYRPNAFGAESRSSGVTTEWYRDEGSAARFFYTAKADADDRLGSKHPTVKPLDLMQYLVRLVTPPGGLLLDPFAGTGTSGEATFREGMRAVLIEREEEYQNDIRRRMALVMAGPSERTREAAKARNKDKPQDHGPLFGGSELSRGGAERSTDTSRTRTNDWADRAQVVTDP